MIRQARSAECVDDSLEISFCSFLFFKTGMDFVECWTRKKLSHFISLEQNLTDWVNFYLSVYVCKMVFFRFAMAKKDRVTRVSDGNYSMLPCQEAKNNPCQNITHHANGQVLVSSKARHVFAPIFHDLRVVMVFLVRLVVLLLVH